MILPRHHEVYALTLWRPWHLAFLHAGKRVENRPWPAPRSLIGNLVALHAGKQWDEDGEIFIRLRGWQACPEEEEDVTAGRIVAVAKVSGTSRWTAPPDGWAFGPFCWWLKDVVAVEDERTYRGRQGLWRLPTDVEDELRELWTKAQGA